MKSVAILLAASGLACYCGLARAAADMCDDTYECRFYVEQDNSLFKFDLSPLCSSQGYAFRDTINTVCARRKCTAAHSADKLISQVLNDTYNFNICGDSPKYCLPSGLYGFLVFVDFLEPESSQGHRHT